MKKEKSDGRTLLVKNIHTLVTMDGRRREIRSGALLVRGNAIARVGTTAQLPDTADEVLDLQDRHIVMPGMVNCHHHFYQVLTRVVKPDGTLFPWLETLYPIWANMRSNDIYLSAKLAAAELLLSGCTTSSDHLYILPNDCALDDEIRAIQEIGMRFTCVRGSMSIGESDGGLPPDSVVGKALGREDIGYLAQGMSADFIAFDIDRESFVGAHADPVAALVPCQNDHVDYSFVNGKKVVDQGHLLTGDYGVLAEKARRAAIDLVRG